MDPLRQTVRPLTRAASLVFFLREMEYIGADTTKTTAILGQKSP